MFTSLAHSEPGGAFLVKQAQQCRETSAVAIRTQFISNQIKFDNRTVFHAYLKTSECLLFFYQSAVDLGDVEDMLFGLQKDVIESR